MAGELNPQKGDWSCPLGPGPRAALGALPPSPEASVAFLHSRGFPGFPSVNTKPSLGLDSPLFVPGFMAQIREAACGWVGWEGQGLAPVK